MIRDTIARARRKGHPEGAPAAWFLISQAPVVRDLVAHGDVLRSVILGAIRSLARDGDLEGVRAALDALDQVIDES